jgi:hypothetical protein
MYPCPSSHPFTLISLTTESLLLLTFVANSVPTPPEIELKLLLVYKNTTLTHELKYVRLT